MKKEQFWQIIDETNRSMQDHDQETYFCRIVEALLHREREDILDWQEILNEYGRAAYRSDLWDKSLELGIHSEEEGFSSFRLWLVSRGKDVYLNVLRNPQALEALVQTCEEPHFEKLDYAAHYAFEANLLHTGSTQQEDLFSAMKYHSLAKETLRDIQADIPPVPMESPVSGQVLSTRDMEILLNSKRLVYGYVYENSGNSKYLIEGAPENLANFLGSHPSAKQIVLTDLLDRFILDTFGFFINRCPDQRLLYEVTEALIPIQSGDTEAKPALCATTAEIEAYYEMQDQKGLEINFSGFEG